MPTGLFVRDLSHLHLPERGARVDQKPGSNAVLKSLERCGRREVLSLQILIVEGEPPPRDAPWVSRLGGREFSLEGLGAWVLWRYVPAGFRVSLQRKRTH